jgi:cytoskeletal protein CcmA (bactofilin family)
VVIGQRGRVEGDIYAEELLIAGEMHGDTYITERLEIGSTGMLDGDVNTRVFVMEEGAVFRGNCKMETMEQGSQKNVLDKTYPDDRSESQE